MNNKKAYIHTWGCQMNEHKSERIAGILSREGYCLVEDPAQADLVIFNTCMVRQKAEEKVYSKAGEIRKYKERNPNLLFGVGGCLAQALKEELFEKIKVDFIFGTTQIGEIPKLLQESQSQRGRNGLRIAMEPTPRQIEELPLIRESAFQAKVIVTEGCSNLCSFCIVPYTTGPLRSRPLKAILKEVKELAKEGCKEVTLLGQNVDSYGKDISESFASLLRCLTEIDIPRIRFTSSHPKDITLEVIKIMGEENNICEHLHMAVQSGSNRILKEMRRGYTKESFLELIHKIKETVPEVNITTDIIVGYPGESEQDFEETMDLVEKARFGGAFIFKYSPRQGTICYDKKDDVPPQQKQRRLETLLELQKQITAEENSKLIGQALEVLVEDSSKGKCRGRTKNNKTISFEGNDKMIGQFVKVKITEASSFLRGEVLR
jgi:tRNA-2-methylthio-N6-dimethylallyladenosine synthase